MSEGQTQSVGSTEPTTNTTTTKDPILRENPQIEKAEQQQQQQHDKEKPQPQQQSGQ